MIQLPSPGSFSLYSSCWHNMAWVDRCLWATPSPLLSIIQAPLPAQARLLKPFKLKAVFLLGRFCLFSWCRWHLLQSISASFPVCLSTPDDVCHFSLELLDQDSLIELQLTHWLYSYFEANFLKNTRLSLTQASLAGLSEEVHGPKGYPVLGRLPG